jgi:hypothetical protein
MGLTLTGLSLGFSVDRPVLHEFLLSRTAYKTYAFQGLDAYAYPVRAYTADNVSEYALTWRAYAHEEFTFLGARWRYGAGFGVGLSLTNAQLQLVDSSYLNAVKTAEFYPTTAIFLQIQMSETDALKLVGSLDASSKYPFSGQLTFLFVMGL